MTNETLKKANAIVDHINNLEILIREFTEGAELRVEGQGYGYPLADKYGCRWNRDGKCSFNLACYFEPSLKITVTKDCIAMTKKEMNIKKSNFKVDEYAYNIYDRNRNVVVIREVFNRTWGYVYEVEDVVSHKIELVHENFLEKITNMNYAHIEYPEGINTAASTIDDKPADVDNSLRLKIATQVMCAMLTNPRENNITGISTDQGVKWAYQIADALIAKNNGNS